MAGLAREERTKSQRDDEVAKPESVGADTLVRQQGLAGGPRAAGTVPPETTQAPVDIDGRSSLLRSAANRFGNPTLARAPTTTPTSLDDLGIDRVEEPEPSWLPTAEVHADTKTPPPASAKDLADADALIKLTPVGTRGPNGTAAFLIAAIDAGFVAAFPKTKKQLQQFVDDKSSSIHSDENYPTKWNEKKERVFDKDAEDNGKAAAHAKGLTIKGTKGSYDVEIDQSPILESLVTIARARIERWRKAGVGSKQVVLSLGDYVRGDPGYGGSNHTTGKAIDVAFLETKVSSEDQAIELVQDLPPGPRMLVYPDGAGVHINVNGKGFDFGFGREFFTGPFLDTQQSEEMKKAGSDHSQPLHATGLSWGFSTFAKSTATWNDEKGWSWSKPAQSAGSAEAHIKSAKLRAVLANKK